MNQHEPILNLLAQIIAKMKGFNNLITVQVMCYITSTVEEVQGV